jgi:uncharacterized protein YwgA
MQKAVFLATQRGAHDWAALYQYKPYDWGPYSHGLALDLDQLVHQKQLKTEGSSSGSRYRNYRTTVAGERRADSVWRTLSAQQREFIKRLRRYVTSKSFNHLLTEVYAAYPAYATKSRFRG